jgi:hypothetical protein
VPDREHGHGHGGDANGRGVGTLNDESDLKRWIERHFPDASRPPSLAAGPFNPVTLAGAWASVTTPGYLKDPMGFVHLQGAAQSGAGTIFTLPAGNRPGATRNFTADGDGAFAVVSITSAGVVSMSVGTAVVGLSLDGITFKATG